MSVYTVHEPPPKRNETAPNPERFAFVRDGFHFWAFLLAPLWMLRHRLWLVLLLYLVAMVAAEVALWAARAPGAVNALVGLLIALLVGFEAASLRRWTLGRRRWRQVGVVIGDDLEAAERRFFDAWASEHARPAAPARPGPVTPTAPAPAAMRAPHSDVVGLFPEPGAPR